MNQIVKNDFYIYDPVTLKRYSTLINKNKHIIPDGVTNCRDLTNYNIEYPVKMLDEYIDLSKDPGSFLDISRFIHHKYNRRSKEFLLATFIHLLALAKNPDYKKLMKYLDYLSPENREPERYKDF